MKKSHLFGTACATVFGFFSMSSHATLIDNGGGLIYDSDRDITWYDAPAVERDLADSMAWAATLSLGNTNIGSWRLPSSLNLSGTGDNVGYDGNVPGYWDSGVAPSGSEMGHLYYVELGNINIRDEDGNEQPGWGLVNKGPFANLEPDRYWSNTWYVQPNNEVYFFFLYGAQGTSMGSSYYHYALAVHDGNVGAVPIPPAIWLFGSGLLGLVGMTRRKKAA